MKNKPEVPIKRTSGGIFMLFGVLADSNNIIRKKTTAYVRWGNTWHALAAAKRKVQVAMFQREPHIRHRTAKDVHCAAYASRPMATDA